MSPPTADVLAPPRPRAAPLPGGAALGRGVAAALLLGCLAASVAGVTLLVRKGSGARKTAVPFAPFLALGAVAAIGLGAPHAF